jgi:hypothetical protein
MVDNSTLFFLEQVKVSEAPKFIQLINSLQYVVQCLEIEKEKNLQGNCLTYDELNYSN